MNDVAGRQAEASASLASTITGSNVRDPMDMTSKASFLPSETAAAHSNASAGESEARREKTQNSASQSVTSLGSDFQTPRNSDAYGHQSVESTPNLKSPAWCDSPDMMQRRAPASTGNDKQVSMSSDLSEFLRKDLRLAIKLAKQEAQSSQQMQVQSPSILSAFVQKSCLLPYSRWLQWSVVGNGAPAARSGEPAE